MNISTRIFTLTNQRHLMADFVIKHTHTTKSMLKMVKIIKETKKSENRIYSGLRCVYCLKNVNGHNRKTTKT